MLQYTTSFAILHMRMKRTLLFLLCGTVTGFLAVFAPAEAQFNPHYLLSDAQLTEAGSFSRPGIRDFLKSKGSGLASTTLSTENGEKTAGDIIYDVSKMYRISPQFLLVLLQKEQSLVTTAAPKQTQLDWATGFGVCDSCSKKDPKIQKFKGFFNQVANAAKRFREGYLADLETRGTTISGWGPGITKNVRCLSYEAARGLCTAGTNVPVTPANKATAALYTYTPHLQGNANLVRLWEEWFFRKFPDGTLVVDSNSETYYVIEHGQKRQFRSLTVLLSSHDPKKAISASTSELALYPTGDPIVFANYSLVQSPRGTKFLIQDGAKRGIVSNEVFRALGFNPEEVIKAPWNDLNLYPDGPVIDLTSAYPTGTLLKSAQTGGITYIENGVRHAVYDKSLLATRLKNVPRIRVTQEEIDRYPVGDPIRFRDGELIGVPESGQPIYFISNGEKRPLASRQAFDRLGFKWRNIVWTSQRVADLHPAGALLDVDDTEETVPAPDVPEDAQTPPDTAAPPSGS